MKVAPGWPPNVLRASNRGPVAWCGVAALLGTGAWLASGADPAALDWQPARFFAQPWRAFSAAFVHFNGLHLAANLAGLVVVALFGMAARVSASMALAWVAAWPLTQIGLLTRPELAHYGGLSGVLHAGVAVGAVHLLVAGRRPQQLIGAAVLAGVLVKVLGEAPWGPALRQPAGWGMAVAPLAHATGSLSGLACAALAQALARGNGSAVPPVAA